MVREGVVRGIFILKFFPWQLYTPPESVLNLLSTLFILIDFPISSDLGESANGTSFVSGSSVLLSSSCSCSVLSSMDSSVAKEKKNETQM